MARNGGKNSTACSVLGSLATGFAVVTVAVAVAGETAAFVRDRELKPEREYLEITTRNRAQQVISTATRGTDIHLDEDQLPAIPNPNDTFAYHACKRGFDLAFSSAVTVFAAVPVALTCVAISLDSQGSPFYVQKRVGRYGIPIRVLKLRTMVNDAENLDKWLNQEQLEQWEREHKVSFDPRITRIGAFLRKTSLDEMPQFINVLIGEMSVIGPRPVEPDELRAYGRNVAEFLSVAPGITGWWQVKSRNSSLYSDGSRQELELHYVRNRSIVMDLEIFRRTFGAMFGREKTGR